MGRYLALQFFLVRVLRFPPNLVRADRFRQP
jgi:hypothetical protein